jgi:hypothetical protein
MYIGNDLQIAHPSYKIIDDISSGFNGSTTSFALQVSGATPVPFPISTQQVMISVNGVVQEPDPNGGAGFKLLGSNIVFSSAPANGHAFFGVINAGADYVTAGSEFPDGSATAPSFTFQDDQDTGWYRNASGDVGYSSNGSAILNFDGNGLTIAAGKGLTVDTSTLKVDAANNRVGIGLTTPQVPLHLDGANTRIQFTAPDTGSAAGDGVILGLNGDEDFFINNRESSKNLLFFTVNAERMRIDSSGRLLLGTTTEGEGDADNLTIADSGNCGISIRSGTSNDGAIFFSDGTSGTDEYKGTIQYTHSNDRLLFKTAATIALTLDSSQNATFAGDIFAGNLAGDRGAVINVESNTYDGISIVRNSNDASTSLFSLGKSRGTSAGSNTVVQSGDLIGRIRFRGADGDELTDAAYIDCKIDATPGNNDMPGSLVFSTTADGAASPTERMRLTSAGKIGINETSPDVALHIKNTSSTFNQASLIKAENTTTGQGSYMLFQNSTDSTAAYVGLDGAGYFNVDAGSLLLTTATGDPVVIATNNGTERFRVTSAGNATATGTVSDSKGNLRIVPQNNKTSSYQLVGSDAGKHITTTAQITVPTGFNAGEMVTIVNNSGSDITIVQGSGLTLYNAVDATTGNRTLAGRGMATILFIGNTAGHISGAGLS